MVISLLDEYRAVRARLHKADCRYPGDPAHQPGLRSFLTDLAAVARDHRLVVSSCAEPEDYTDWEFHQAPASTRTALTDCST
jgi:hypothetical protein